MYHSCNIPDLVGHTIDEGRLRLIGTIGSGSNGVIFLAEDTTSLTSPPTQYAVKCVVRAEHGSRRYNLQRQEIAFHHRLSSHPNVVTLHRVIEDKYYVFLVLDYCRGGDLFNYLSNRREYRGDDAIIKRLFLQIVDALEACHAAGVYHRDLKPENILISEDAEHIYLTDFGLATANMYSRTYGAGSSLYMSPECIGWDPARPAYNTSANDVWALGVILTSMVSGHNPWNNACPSDACYRAFMRNDRFLAEMLPLSPGAGAILMHLFSREPTSYGDTANMGPGRMSLEELRVAVETLDTFFMRPSLIAASGEYLRASAATYFDGSPHAARYLIPPTSSTAPLAQTEEGSSASVSTSASRSRRRRRDSPSSVESSDGPNTPQMLPQHMGMEVADLAQDPRGSFMDMDLPKGCTSAKRRRSMSPAGFIRRFMDRFFTE
ncbi:kinase-like domain-containing protein [Trametes gibbosa]|nr:kinase-like domain-containing protein [Trametes gibbosa]